MIVRGNALSIPVADESVDLLITSPPYFALRSYRDADEHYAGQLGSEPTPQGFVDNLLRVMDECRRVIKPSGSVFINLGDKYAGSNGQSGGASQLSGATYDPATQTRTKTAKKGGYVPKCAIRPKSLMGLPWRFANACIDNGWILRRDIIWHKLNGLPESVTDRCRSSHEYVFHFTKEERYFSSVDEIREPHQDVSAHAQSRGERTTQYRNAMLGGHTLLTTNNPLGKLPGSVWSIPSEPLIIPDWAKEKFDLPDHFAAYPTELVRRIVLGWSPNGVCVECGEGRRPVVAKEATATRRDDASSWNVGAAYFRTGKREFDRDRGIGIEATITGYACACTPSTKHPGTGETSGPTWNELVNERGTYKDESWPHEVGTKGGLRDRPKVGSVREYHLNGWTPPPTKPATVLDPFGGTGTTTLVAEALGRKAISLDLSADYSRLAKWRCSQPATKVMSRTWKSRQGALL